MERVEQPKRTKFLVELIKPSHYDDDGYVIQWWRGFIPSNSLSSIYGLALDSRNRRVLGDDVDIEIQAHDETNTKVPVREIIRRFARNDNRGLVLIVGVQTNQFARAVDIARELRAANLDVAIGGFHVSGCLAMLPELPQDLKDAQAAGITLFAGEAEERLDDLLKSAFERRLLPLYNFMKNLPAVSGTPLPFLPLKYVKRYAGAIGCFDAGRGCPFSCSFCTIINVQGRKSRYRTADDIEHLIRAHAAQGVRSFFITDDNFARNKNWEPILDRIIELRRRDHLRLNIIMQVDTLCHKIPKFIEKAARAGCKKVFIGLENINPESLKGASKGQNQITEYRKMLQAWKKAKVLTYAGYILGFPSDTPESIARDIQIIQRELPIDIMEFFMLTPLPGSKDHLDMYLRGERMETDTNKYDAEHATADHPRMTAAEWEDIYQRAWHLYYTPEHIVTLIKRAVASGIRTSRIASMIFYFYASHKYEHVHPLQGGIIRRKRRTQRRPGYPRENVFSFALRRTREMLSTYGPGLMFFWQLERLRRKIEKDPASKSYTDLALTPVNDHEFADDLELYHATDSARRAAELAQSQEATRKLRLARTAFAAE
ncbi:MAG: radical SAM protein [Candidatus Binatus sp.]|uniref:B12-binding domain-containing radical SAM protein n=1 Tax=Candidatus Binatus sp. TaxID=2811406 RepID=UPI002728CA9D|nr:radical SAM protein [Candidatus Binatus sp.]MDO8434727.1 radical SAM protein [Candidatus Binatus sp.]